MNAPANLQNPIRPWENEYWSPEPIFSGQTVVCIASGPSLTAEVCERIRVAREQGRCRVIVVNSSCRLAPWADVLFFTDSGWYADRKELVREWPGLVVSMSRLAKRELDDPTVNRSGKARILRIVGVGAPPFPPRQNGVPKFPPLGQVQQGRNSGNTAVALAISMGAAVVPLVGYDCRLVNGREHFHQEYVGPRDLGLYDREFLHAFDGWNEAALASGVRILNATPDSAIKEFPFVDLDEVLSCGPSHQ